MSTLDRLARKAHEAWPRDLSHAEVLSLLGGWSKWGPGMPRTEREQAWLDGLRMANEALFLDVVAQIPVQGTNQAPEELDRG